MGVWIGYRHRTKDLNKIKKLILDLKTFSENTNRHFRIINSKGFSADKSGEKDTKKDKQTLFEFEDKDYSSSFMPSKNIKPSREIYFEIEIKSGKSKNHVEYYGVGWHFRDGWWIAKGAQKIYPGIPKDKAVGSVVEIIGILEYIKSRYFPNFKIDDQFDFHVNYDEKTDADKEHLKWVSSEEWRKKMGISIKRNYHAEELKLKHHDINNIIKNVTGMDEVMGFIKRDLTSKGFKKDNFIDPKSDFAKKLFPKSSIRGTVSTFIPTGNNMIEAFHNTIDDLKIRYQRKRTISLTLPKSIIRRQWITRRDGHKQRYHKRLLYKGEQRK